MGHPRCSEADFIELFKAHGTVKTAEMLGMNERAVRKRRLGIERRNICQIAAPDTTARQSISYPGRLRAELRNGVALIGSDAHYWPGEPTTAHRAFVRFCREQKPEIVILNGDGMDGASNGRHAPIMWEKKPTLAQELEVCQERLGEIEQASKAKLYWPLGNHDARFESRLAQQAPEYANIQGVHLKDHFPAWEPCWSLWLNDDVVVKHRWKGGVHAAHNNTKDGGKSIVTGHLHSPKVAPWTDFTGTRFGVDSGTLADCYGPQFEYIEDGARNWISGFVMLTFRDGKLMWPEIIRVLEPGKVEFRTQIIEV